MTDPFQPGGAIVFRQHAVHDVLVDLDPKCVRLYAQSVDSRTEDYAT